MKAISAQAAQWAFHILLASLPLGTTLVPFRGMRIHLWAADLILVPTTAFLVVTLFLKNRQALVPPLGIQFFCLSIFGCLVLNPSNSWVDALQLLVYSYGTWLLVSQTQSLKSRYNVFFFIFILNLLILSALGCYQALEGQAPHYLIRGVFPNYHVFSAFLALCFLYVLPILLIQRSRLYLSLAAALGIGFYVCVKSPPSIVAWTLGLWAQVILISYYRSEWKNSRLVLSSLGGMLVLGLGILIQPNNLIDITEYLHPYEPGNVDMKFSEIQTMIALPNHRLVVGEVKAEFVDPFLYSMEIKPRDRYQDLNNHRLITQRLVERMVALNMAESHPATGVGIGKYQEAKDYFFGSVVKVNTTEPYSYSSLATALGTGGIVLLIGLLAFLSGQIFNIGRNFQQGKSKRALLIGAFGSGIGFLTLAYQMDVLIAPTFVLFTIITTHALRDYSRELEDVFGEGNQVA